MFHDDIDILNILQMGKFFTVLRMRFLVCHEMHGAKCFASKISHITFFG